jgi:hypothetical protein
MPTFELLQTSDISLPIGQEFKFLYALVTTCTNSCKRNHWGLGPFVGGRRKHKKNIKKYV